MKRSLDSVFGLVFIILGSLILTAIVLVLLLPTAVPEPFNLSGPSAENAFIGNLHDGAGTELLQDGNQGTPGSGGEAQLIPDHTGDSASLIKANGETIESSSLGERAAFSWQANQVVQASISSTGAAGSHPRRIVIPAIGIDAPILPVTVHQSEGEEGGYWQWSVPNSFAAGWHDTSALLGTPGNTVLNGHNNIYGAIFGDLAELEAGDRLILYDEERAYEYEVSQRDLFEEDGLSLKERYWNARWMLPTSDERVTLITCWPNSTNTHRLVIVAKRVVEAGS